MNDVQNLRDLKQLSPTQLRRLIRTGQFTEDTTGLAMGYIQANLAIMPEKYALDFATFCQRNPKPCPLIAVSEVGSVEMPTLAHDFDLRTDVSKYRIFRNGVFVEAVAQIGHFVLRQNIFQQQVALCIQKAAFFGAEQSRVNV